MDRWIPAVWLPTVAALTLAAKDAGASDLLLLQQAVPPEVAARVQLLLDRERVIMAELRQQAKPPHLVEITLDGRPPIVLAVRCQDVASARQVLEALRPRSSANLDVSGRCRF